MKPGKPLKRKTPLVAKTQFARTTPMQRASRLTRSVMAKKRPQVTPEERSARKVVRARSEGTCECCGGHKAESMHHRRKAGRVWKPENLIHTCGDGTRGCHGWIEANPTKAQGQGWWVPSHKDPAKTPLWLAGRGWAFLNADGSVEEAPEEEVA